MNRAVPIIAAAVFVVLIAGASGYGYHRDELYFLAAGQHLDWAYADQGPVTPLIARAMSELFPDSLTALRAPSALAAGATVLLTGLLARELGGSRRAETIAAAVAAVASFVLIVGHLLSTTTFDLLVWTALVWLVVRAIRTGDDRLWLVAGAVLGIGLLNKPLPAFLAIGLLAGVLVAGPRRLLRSPWVWAGAAIALVIWSPWLIWQAGHGWPQLEVSEEIAAGGSGTSEPWWTILPFQLLLVSPLLAPVWIAGLVALFRDPGLRRFRFLVWAWVALALVFMAAGGKPYYLGGLLPVLIAAGAISVDRWLERGRTRLRAGALAAAVALSAVVGLLLALPVLPADDAEPVVALNGEAGETIGWPELVETVADVHRDLPDPDSAVILTDNYGEAGAIERFGPALGLPPAYSGHNAYGDWGPPPDGGGPVIAVGLEGRDSPVAARLGSCELVARIGNDAGIENDEEGAAVFACTGPERPWSRIWDELTFYG